MQRRARDRPHPDRTPASGDTISRNPRRPPRSCARSRIAIPIRGSGYCTCSPRGIDDELLDVIATYPQRMPVPGHAPAARQRRGPRAHETAAEREGHSRLARPRTRSFAGHQDSHDPHGRLSGETEEQFEELLDFVDEAGVRLRRRLRVLTRGGSAAYGFDGQIDDDERLGRAQRLLDACEAVGTARIARLAGTCADVLVERP